MATKTLAVRTIDELTIDDEKSFGHVGLYRSLKEVLRRSKYTFRVLPDASPDRALLLNLTFWGANAGGDVLVDDVLPADVVAHAAWHHLAAKALADGSGAPLSVDALFLGEAIASAFDVYLVGRLLGRSPNSSFLATQVPAMADCAEAAGLSEDDFEALLESVAADPEGAFEDLRQLLFDATTSLTAASGFDDALGALDKLDEHRFAPLLHHYELSNWVLYARAYGRGVAQRDERVLAIDRELRTSADSIDWLTTNWVDKRAAEA